MTWSLAFDIVVQVSVPLFMCAVVVAPLVQDVVGGDPIGMMSRLVFFRFTATGGQPHQSS
jgi:hypothetical protein